MIFTIIVLIVILLNSRYLLAQSRKWSVKIPVLSYVGSIFTRRKEELLLELYTKFDSVNGLAIHVKSTDGTVLSFECEISVEVKLSSLDSNMNLTKLGLVLRNILMEILVVVIGDLSAEKIVNNGVNIMSRVEVEMKKRMIELNGVEKIQSLRLIKIDRINSKKI